MEDGSGVILTQRLSNNELRSFSFENAFVALKQGFLIIHYDKAGRNREDWFAVGTVIRLEKLHSE